MLTLTAHLHYTPPRQLKQEERAERLTYESVSSALARLSVCDDDRLVDVAELLEERLQALVRRVVRQAAHENLRVRCILLQRYRHLVMMMIG